MKKYLLIITLLWGYAFSHAQESKIWNEAREILSSSEFEEPIFARHITPFGSLTAEEIRMLTAERWDLWSINTDAWEAKDSTEFYYDELGRTTGSLKLRYDEETAQWEKQSRALSSSNDQGLVDTTVVENWNGEEWQTYRREFFTYDAEGRLIEGVGELWDDSEEIWRPIDMLKNEFESATGFLFAVSIFYFNPDLGEFLRDTRREFFYDQVERDSATIRYTGYEGVWWPRSRETYEFQSLDSEQPSKLINEVSVDGEWVLRSRYRFIYDGNNAESYIETWNGESGEWEPSSRLIAEWDDEYRLLSQLRQFWIDSTSSYQDVAFIENDYYADFTVHKSYSYEESLDEFVNNRCWIGYYTTIVSTEEQPTAEHPLYVYPNPNKGLFTVDLSNTSLQQSASLQLRCTDLQGRTIMMADVEPAGSTVEVSLPNVPTGTYLLYLTDGRQLWQQKLVIQQ
jgi:hypothetical protein